MANPSTPSPFRSGLPPADPAARRPPDFRTAQELHKAGRLIEAEAAYRQWLSLHPADAAAFAQSLTVDVASNVTLNATAGPVEGDTASLVIDYCDPQGFSADTLVVDWDDGSSDQSVAAASVVDLSHVYAHGGTTYNVTVTADSVAGPVAAGPVPIYVNAPGTTNDPHEQISIDADTGVAAGSPLGIRFTAIGAFMSYCGRGVEDYPVGSAYTIDWGDSLTSAAGGTQPSDSEFDGTGSHTYAHDGQYLVTVTDESDGASASEFVTVAAPTLTIAAIPDQTVDEGSSLTFSTTFSGAETGEYSQAWVNWGDGRGNLPATISGNAITAYTPVVGANITMATVILAGGTTVPATQQANVAAQAPTITSMTATDASNSDNTVKVTGGSPGNIYVNEASSGPNAGSASVVFAATWAGTTASNVFFAPEPTLDNVHWAPGTSTLILTPRPGTTGAQWDCTVDANVGGGKAQQTITIHVFKLEITASNGTPLSATTPFQVVVGQKVTLGYATVGDAPPVYYAGGGEPWVSWTVPGNTPTNPTAIKAYDLSGTQPVSLSDYDTTQSTVSFYWIAPAAAAQAVSLRVLLGHTGSVSYTTSAPFIVNAPTVTTFSASLLPAGVKVGPVLGSPEPWNLHYGSPIPPGGNEQNGQLRGAVFTATVSSKVPALGQAGTVAIVQLANDQWTYTDQTGNHGASTGGKNYLDNGGLSTAQVGQATLPDTSTATVMDIGQPGVLPGDAPAEGITGDLSFKKNEQYTDFLMFQPAASGSVWVTLATLTWGWDAAGAWIPASRSYSLTSHPAPNAQPITGVPSSLEPTWSGLMKDEPQA